MRLFLYAVLMVLVLFASVVMSEGADVTLAWEAPTLNADGSPLTDLQGYVVIKNGEWIAVGNVTTWTDSNLDDGTYTYTVKAVDVNGNASDDSNAVTYEVKIPPASPTNATCQAVIINNCIGCVQECK